MARKGVRVLHEAAGEATQRRGEPVRGRPVHRPGPADEVWVLEAVVDEGGGGRREAGTGAAAGGRAGRGAGTRGGSGARTDEFELPTDVVHELAAAVGHDHAGKLGERMAAAARAYERDRYAEAFRLTKQLVDQVPESAAARELHGLVCYRLDRWSQAIAHLDAARALGDDDTSQLPVLMDCHRALHRHRRVAALWEELRAASPSPDILVEGRLVLASDLADQGKLAAAVDVLTAAGAARRLRNPGERHVRQWYVLADLYERAGDLPHARELFAWVVAADPGLADAAERLSDLGRGRRPRAASPASSPRVSSRPHPAPAGATKPAAGKKRASRAAR